MIKEGTLFSAVSNGIACFLRFKKEGKDITLLVKEVLETIDEVEMQVSFPEQQAAGGAIIVSAKMLLPDMTKDGMLTLAPFFHSGLELISSFDKLPSFRWKNIEPLFHHYMSNIPKEVPSALKYLDVIKRILDVMKLSKTVTDDFFAYDNIIGPARIITTAMEYAKNPDGDLALKKLAIDVLSRIVRQCPPEKAATVGVVISGYLGGLLKVIRAPNIADILESAITLFTDAVVFVFGDDAVKFDAASFDKSAVRESMHFFFEFQTDEWRDEADKTIFSYVKAILERHMRNRAHNVKTAVCDMVLQIQSRCTNVFGTKFYHYLLYIYASMRYEEAVYFQDLSKSCLDLVQDKKVSEAYFYKELDTIVRRLPVETRCGHGDREFRILCAVLDGLGEAVSLMCTMESRIIEQVIQCVVDGIVINKKGMQITSEGVSVTVDQELRKFKLKHSLSHSSIKNVARILAELGKFEVVHIVHRLMKDESAGRRTGYHLLLAYMLANLKKRDASPDEPTIMMLAEYIVEEANKSCVMYLKSDAKPGTEGLENDWNTCIESLSCTNVALCMKFVSGNANRSNIVIKSICTILNQSISTSWIVVETADFALKVIADHDERVNDVIELVTRYSSYILNTISLACSSSENYHVAPILLRAYLRYDSIDDRFDNFRVIIEKMLYALDNNEQKYTIALLQAIQAFVSAISKENLDLQPIYPSHDSEDQKCLPTPEHQLVEKVLLRTKHMLTSTHLPVQITCLQILTDGLDVLKNYDDILLPMIHQNWHGLMVIMKQREAVSMTPAIEVIAEMAAKSGTFVHNKILREMWPEVGSYLIHCFENDSSWHYSEEYRLVIKILELLPELVANIGLTKDEMNDSFMILLNTAIDADGTYTKFSRTQKSQIERYYKDLAVTGRKLD